MADLETIQRLAVSFEARTAAFEKALVRIEKQNSSSFSKIESDGKKHLAALESALSRTSTRMNSWLKSTAIGLASALSAQNAKEFIDSAIRIENALKVAGLSGTELTKVYKALYTSAQDNAAPLEALVTLYGRAAQQQKELGVSTEQLLKFTNDIAVALRVSGTSASAAQGALLQLGQLLGSGTVHAEEFNSVLEGVPTIVQAAARGIKEANGSVAQLKQLVVSGKVSSKAFFDGFEAGAVTLQSQVAGAQTTISGGFIRLYNVLTDVAKNFNENAHAADLMAGFLDELGTAVRELGNGLSAAAPFLKDFGDYLNWINSIAEGMGKRIGAATGLDQVAPAINNALNGVETDPVKAKLEELQKTVTALQDAIKFNTEMGIDTSTVQAQLNQVLAKIAAIKSGAAAVVTPLADQSDQGVTDAINRMVPFNPLSPVSTPTETKQISLADYPVTGSKKSGGGSKAIKKTAQDAFDQDITEIRNRIAAMKEEQATLGLSFEAQQKRKISLELEQQALKDVQEAARKKGDTDWQNAKLSTEQIAQIDAVSEAYARQADQLREAKEEQDLERDVLKGALGDLRSALDDGKLTWQDFGNIAINALDKIINKIEDELIDAIIQANSAAGGGGIFGSVLSLFGIGGGGNSVSTAMDSFQDVFSFAGGGKVRGPGTTTSDSIPAMLSDKEFVVNAGAAEKHHALLEAINSGKILHFARGGSARRYLPSSLVPSDTTGRNGPTDVTFKIDVSNARGDRDLEGRTMAAVKKGIDAYDRQMPVRLGPHLQKAKTIGSVK